MAIINNNADKNADNNALGNACCHALQALALPAGATLAVAYSGGMDSSVLLDAVSAYARQHGITLYAFHIHHGLSPHADAWLQHCAQICTERGLAFDARHIVLGHGSVEEAARIQRYAALGELCRLHHVDYLLTAHHQDDQAETVLLQLLRGTGVAGLSGMDSANTAATLLGDPHLRMARPLLTVTRAQIEAYAQAATLSCIEDESNADQRYARNALRLQVMPLLAQLFPGFQQRFTRTATHAQSAQRLLIALAAQDLQQCLDGDCLAIAAIKQFDTDRIDNVLRYWFGLRGMRMPSSAWLTELRTQLLEAKVDAQLCVTHPECHIRRHRDRVYMTPRRTRDISDIAPQMFVWNGQLSMRFADFDGVLHFDPVDAEAAGIDAQWLRQQSLWLRYRSGGERLKLAPNRPTKNVKYHYQALDIPAWERLYLPLVGSAKAVLFAAGIGMDCQHQRMDGERVSLRWQAC